MTVSAQGEAGSTEKLILRALILSLLVHCLVFGVWKVGQAQGWWRLLAVPHWWQTVAKLATPMPPKTIAAVLPKPVPLLFVEVDPATPVEEPKTPQFYGAHSTVAGNPQITKPSALTDIRGRQDKALKTMDHGRPITKAAKPAPQVQPTPHQVASAQPKKTYLPGNLAMAEPSEKAQEKQGSANETSPQQTTPPVYQRPRTIEEAMARKGLSGQKMRQVGGINHISPDSELSVKGTISGEYFNHFVDTIQAHWDQLLDQDPANANGKVVLHFKLHANGQVTEMKMVSNEVTDLLGTLCERAVLDPAPYDPWPQQMRLENAGDTIDLQFTFYYETY